MRPYVIMNAGMTLDGKIAAKSGDSAISCKKDLERVHKIRESVDAIMVGINTVIADDPRLTVHKIKSKSKNPIRIVVDSKGRMPLDARMLKEEGETIVCMSLKAKKEVAERISEKTDVIICGKNRVDLKCLMEKLYKRGIRRLLLEGGGNLNFGMLKDGLVDEVRVAIAPKIVGGKEAVTLVEGAGFSKIEDGIKLGLLKYYALGDDLIIEYRVGGE